MSITEFNSLLVSNSGSLKPYAITLTRDSEQAKDLFQETMARALAYKQQYNTGTNIRAWLHTIMRNIFINDYRRRMKLRMIPTSHLADQSAVEKYLPVHNNGEQELNEQELWREVDHLPELFRQPFMLHFYGYKYNDIARRTNEPMGTIKSRIHQARKMLKETIQKNRQFGLG